MKRALPEITIVVLCMLLIAAALVGAGLGLSGCGAMPAGSTQGEVSSSTNPEVPVSPESGTPTTSLLASDETRAEPTAQAQNDAGPLVTGNSAFALDLFQAERATAESLGKNLVLSPYGLSVALGMTYAGARGETEAQLADALDFELSQERLHPAFNALDLALAASKGATLTVANSLWPFAIVEDRIIPGYLDLVAREYGASVIRPPGDVEQARQAINAWVSDATDGRVKEVLPPGSLPGKLTAMVLIDAISFSGRWTFAFPPSNTRTGEFHLADGSTIQAPFMHHAMDFGYAEDESWQMVDIPYGVEGTMEWGDFSMVCLLPRQASLDDAVNGLSPDNLGSLVGNLSADELVRVSMPRFKFDSSFQLKPIFQSLGMTDAFDSGRADFSGMYQGEPPSGIWIDDIYQTATIGVDEKGTEAAAGSAVVQVAGIGPTEIVLDHPFLFLIRHRPTGTILFMGQVTNPAEG